MPRSVHVPFPSPQDGKTQTEVIPLNSSLPVKCLFPNMRDTSLSVWDHTNRIIAEALPAVNMPFVSVGVKLL